MSVDKKVEKVYTGIFTADKTVGTKKPKKYKKGDKFSTKNREVYLSYKQNKIIK